MYLIKDLWDVFAEFNPSPEFITALRVFNVAAGFTACMALLFFLARKRWREWNVPIRLGVMALFLLCASGTYGSFEVAFLDTYFRVPLITISLIWAILAALWPRNKTKHWSRKK